MIITHAIIGPVGAAMLLLGVLALTASARTRGPRRTDPDVVPLWWDQSPTSGTSVGSQGSPTHG
jgi:hypothetical protein